MRGLWMTAYVILHWYYKHLIRIIMSKKKTVEEKIDDLALSVAKGFDEVYKRTQNGTEQLRKELGGVESRLAERLDRIEYHVGRDEARISTLEARMRQVLTKLGLSI